MSNKDSSIKEGSYWIIVAPETEGKWLLENLVKCLEFYVLLESAPGFLANLQVHQIQ